MSRSKLTVVIPLPPRALMPNVPTHWVPKAKATAKQREAGYLAGVDAINRYRPDVPFAAATVQPIFYFRKKQRRDKDNFSFSLKAARDGVADAGVVTNDEHFTPLPAVFRVDADDPRVELIIVETEPEV